MENKIIEQARTWLGTRFRYQGRIKKNTNNNGGVDCLGLIIGVCDELNYTYNGKSLKYYDSIEYSTKPNYNLLKTMFKKFFKEKEVEDIAVGDIVLKQISTNQYHLMFYTGTTFIHASAITKSVVEHNVDNLENCNVYSLKNNLN